MGYLAAAIVMFGLCAVLGGYAAYLLYGPAVGVGVAVLFARLEAWNLARRRE